MILSPFRQWHCGSVYLLICEHVYIQTLKKRNFRKLNGTMPVKICNVASVCCQEADFCYVSLNMFYWLFNLLQQNLCLSDRLLNYWLASSWTLCHWSQPFQLSSPTPPSSYPAHTSSCQWKCYAIEGWKLKPLSKSRETSTSLHTSTKLVILSPKAMILIRHDFQFLNPCWLFQITLMSLIDLETFLRAMCSILFPGIEVKLNQPIVL